MTQRAHLAALALCVLPACDFMHGVGRTTSPGNDFDPTIATEAVQTHPAFDAAWHFPWDGKYLSTALLAGDANAQLFYDAEQNELAIHSGWINRDPSPRVMQQSLRLQRELHQLLQARTPSLPDFADWQTRWIYMEPVELEDGKTLDDVLAEDLPVLTKPAACPSCQGAHVVPILYGRLTAEASEVVAAKHAVAGGCEVGPGYPDWACIDCEHQWFVASDPARIANEKRWAELFDAYRR